MLRKIRITLAAVCFVLINMLFLGISWGISQHIAWVAKIQFLPALLALDYAMLLVLIAVTLLFGRIYCSVICPLGIMQDIFGWAGKKAKKNRYSHSPEKKWLRYSVLAVFILCLIIGFAPVTTLLAPYSAYGRIVNSVFRPLYDLLNNGLAAFESRYDSYVFSEVQLWMRSVTTFMIALLTFIILGFLAWRNGRTYCNTVCPVGTILSFFSRFSLMRVQMDKSRCKNCSLCEKNCKTAAIDYKSGTVDAARCITCGDCLDKCKFDALHYKPVLHLHKSTQDPAEPDLNKRAFLTGAVLATSAAVMAETRIKMDGGLAVIEDKQAPHRETPVTPPGSVSAYNLNRHCTACQLCVSACPNNVLRPSADPLHLMQPVMSFERGYCRPECTRCSQVCPTGAIRPITKEEKTAIHIGHAVWIEQNCIPVSNGDHCGACARHCPAWAIQMVEKEVNGKLVEVPVVDSEKCVGCGKCENLCPARPFSAIYVEGNKMHHLN
ncbi:MAG: 4Fe-4S dicluster domain-containing protein [Paludibacteraceae bacterium]|nr:4Fe-4S dicluster domain-containing protein [Paludibacteraceae bacterium]